MTAIKIRRLGMNRIFKKVKLTNWLDAQPRSRLTYSKHVFHSEGHRLDDSRPAARRHPSRSAADDLHDPEVEGWVSAARSPLDDGREVRGDSVLKIC